MVEWFVVLSTIHFKIFANAQDTYIYIYIFFCLYKCMNIYIYTYIYVTCLIAFFAFFPKKMQPRIAEACKALEFPAKRALPSRFLYRFTRFEGAILFRFNFPVLNLATLFELDHMLLLLELLWPYNFIQKSILHTLDLKKSHTQISHT